MSKKKKYVVVLAFSQGEDANGIPVHYFKYVSAWPSNAREWGARFEMSPNLSDALKFGRDTALDVANTIRMRNAACALAMVMEA